MNPKTIDSPRDDVAVETLPVRGWRSRLDRDWSSWADSRAAAYLVFAAVYIVPSVVLARQKSIWDDEFYTLYLSRTKSWSDLWRALSTGADQHPPTFYYLNHLIFKVAGTTHVLFRSTAIFGFALSCVCLYEIVRRMVGPRWAFSAILLPLTTPTAYFATEARGYGLELGFITCSLLMWLWATEGKKRSWTVPGLACALFFAVASHYYAVFILVPLAIGELVKIKVRRSVDFPIWAALCAALLPPLLFAPLILRALPYSKNFWAVPAWGQMLAWYPDMLGRAPLILVAVAALVFVLGISAMEDWRLDSPSIPFPVTIAFAASSLLPVFGIFAAKLVTHAFAERYFIAALPASCIFLVWALRRISCNEKVGPALVAALCIILAVQQWRDQRTQQISMIREFRSAAALLRETKDTPIVISEPAVFHRLSFYAQRDLASRLVYVADPHREVRYLGHDTVDRGLLALTPWFPLRVIWWDEWWKVHPSSLVYGRIGDWTWLTFALQEVGTAELKDRDTSRLLLILNRTTVPDNDHLPGDPSGKPMLYDQLPVTGPSLCKLYMPTDNCSILDGPNVGKPIKSYTDLYVR